MYRLSLFPTGNTSTQLYYQTGEEVWLNSLAEQTNVEEPVPLAEQTNVEEPVVPLAKQTNVEEPVPLAGQTNVGEPVPLAEQTNSMFIKNITE